MKSSRAKYLLVIVLMTGFLIGSVSRAQDQGGLPKTPENWEVSEIAAYPEIRYPSVVEVAPDGRVFVGEDPKDMPGPVGEPIDRIVCFHPDGRKTVVEENLHAVFGLLFIDGKLYVNHPPKVTVLDVEGGKATSRRTLIESLGKEPWKYGFNDHIPSQIRLGMDGFIYMSVGDKGIYNAKGTDGSNATLHGGGIFRFRPDATDLEVYASGTRNHLDVAINSQDEMFTYDNTDDGNGWWTRVTHMVDGGFYGYPHDYKPRRPYTLWMMQDYGGGSPTGATAYTGARLPEKYHEDLFMCEWGKRSVVRFDVSRTGATFRIDERDRFFSKGEGEFTPVGIAQAQDGVSFYVTDWNYGGWTADEKTGQLFKFSYTGETRDVPVPDWYGKAGNGGPLDVSTGQLIEDGLKHPAKRVRMVAQRRIADRGKQVIRPVVQLLKADQAPEHAKWHGIWTLDAIDGGRSTRNLIISLTKSDHPASVRRQAMRQLGTREAGQATETLVNQLDDKNASIRFYAATALGRIGNPRAVDPLLNGLKEDDLFARYAKFNALNRIGRASPNAWDEIANGLKHEDERIRNGTRFAMRETYMVENVKALSEVVRNAKSRHARKAALKTLVPLLRKQKPWDGEWWGTQPIKSGPRPKTETWKGTEIVRKTIETVLEKGSKSLKKEVIKQLSIVFSRPEPVRNWQLLGPFERKRSLPFEPGNVSLEQSYEGKNGTVSWTEARGNEKHGFIDLQDVFGDKDHVSTFARTTLNVDEAMDTKLVLGSDDGLRVWVNGENVFEDMGTRGWGPDQFRVPVSLEKGENEIVCKIEENEGSWAFSVKYIPQDFMQRIKGE